MSRSEILKERRSIRKYLPKDVPKEIILKLLEASRWAPSAHNAQPWRFIIIDKAEVKRKLAEEMANSWIKDLRRDKVPTETQKDLVKASIEQFTKAPLLIVSCLTMEDMDEYPDRKRQEAESLMAVQSLAAAIENMLLAAWMEGLGACWFCAPLFCQEVVKKVLKIPKSVEVQALITLGYPDEKPNPPPRKPLDELIHFNYWGNKR
ncbi:MAG: nitroreductase family protein [Candidatus Bathyarchaeia archaeon]